MYGETAEAPQEALFNQYAAMYELYTIRQVRIKWMPFRPWTYAVNNDVKSALFIQTYSVWEPDSSGPVTTQEYLAHSYLNNKVCHVNQGYECHERVVDNPLKILEIVENKEYFNTNGSWSSRETIPSSASMSFRVYSPYNGAGTLSEFGTFIVSYTYAFAS